jgi:hypothetical protein
MKLQLSFEQQIFANTTRMLPGEHTPRPACGLRITIRRDSRRATAVAGHAARAAR